jgi:hypothetical protein
MARWSSQEPTWTTAALADTTNLTDTAYHALQGGSSTQRINILEVYIGGQASASAPNIMLLARDSTVGATLSVGRQAALDPATAALAAPMTTFNTATTKPQRSATLSLLNLSFNAFGGIVRWVAAPGEEIGMLGNTASLGEVSLSAFTGSTAGLSARTSSSSPSDLRWRGGRSWRSPWPSAAPSPPRLRSPGEVGAAEAVPCRSSAPAQAGPGRPGPRRPTRGRRPPPSARCGSSIRRASGSTRPCG